MPVFTQDIPGVDTNPGMGKAQILRLVRAEVAPQHRFNHRGDTPRIDRWGRVRWFERQGSPPSIS